MQVNGTPYRPIRQAENGWAVEIIDQTKLPHHFKTTRLETPEAAATAIKDMLVRGAPLIGATAAYGMALAMHKDAGDGNLAAAYTHLLATRPTAVNLRWALDELKTLLLPLPPATRCAAAYRRAAEMCDEDVAMNAAIGDYGSEILKKIWAAKQKSGPLNILTHCNAGWLATVDWGTATAPIYKAHAAGMPLHVWVDETRPRNQGASLTAWELAHQGVPHSVITDNAGGHVMQHGLVDVVITGSDRTTASGDVCNKIGTYLKALAARDNNIPFYVALPSPTIDWTVSDGVTGITIEERSAREVTHITGKTTAGEVTEVQLTPDASVARNYAFDVTPARLVTGFITERGIAKADRLAALFADHAVK